MPEQPADRRPDRALAAHRRQREQGVADLLAHHMLRVHEGDADGLPVHLEPHEELAPLQGKRRDKQRIQIYGSRPFRAEKLRLRPGQQQRQRGLAVDHGSSDVSAQGDLALGGVIRDAPAARREHALAERYIRELNIVTPSAEQETVYLSGGNQQKVVIGKWINCDADIYIFDAGGTLWMFTNDEGQAKQAALKRHLSGVLAGTPSRSAAYDQSVGMIVGTPVLDAAYTSLYLLSA